MFASYGSEQRKISSESRSLVPQAEKDSLWQFKHSAVTRAEVFLKMTDEEFIAEMRRYSISNNKLRPDITLFLSQTLGLSYVDEVKDDNGTIQKAFQRFIQNPVLRNEYAQIILDREATYISVIHPAVRQAVFAYGYQLSHSLLLLDNEAFVREMSAKFPDCESLNLFLANIAFESATIDHWLLSKIFYFPTLLQRYLPDLDRLFPKEKRAHPVNFMRTKVHEAYDPEWLREEEIHERINHVREKYRGISSEVQQQAFIWVAHKAGRGSIYIFNTCHRLSINFEEVFGPHLVSVLSKVSSVCGEILNLHAAMPDAIIVGKARKLGKKIFALENEKMRECAAKFAKEEPIKPAYLNSTVKEVEDWTGRYLASANSALEQPAVAVDHSSQVKVQRKHLEQINIRTLLWTTLLLAKSEALESTLAAVGHNHGGLLLNVLMAEGYTVTPVLKAPLALTNKEEKNEGNESEDDIEPSQIKKRKVFGKFGDASNGPDISKEPINRNHLFAKEDARGIKIASVNKQDKLHPRSP